MNFRLQPERLPRKPCRSCALQHTAKPSNRQRSGPATASYGHGRGSDPPPGTLKSDTTGPAASELASVAGKGKQPARSGTQQSPKASASAFAQPKEPVPNIPQDTSRKLPSQGATLQQTNRALSPGATPSYLQHPGGGGGEGKSITPGIKSSAGNIGGQLALRPATGATATASGRQPTGTVSWSSEAPTKGTYHVSRATERGVLGASSGSGRGGGSGGGGGRGGGSAGGGGVPPKVHRSHKGSDESSLDSVRNRKLHISRLVLWLIHYSTLCPWRCESRSQCHVACVTNLRRWSRSGGASPNQDLAILALLRFRQASCLWIASLCSSSASARRNVISLWHCTWNAL